MFTCDYCGEDVGSPENLIAVWNEDNLGLLFCADCTDRKIGEGMATLAESFEWQWSPPEQTSERSPLWEYEKYKTHSVTSDMIWGIFVSNVDVSETTVTMHQLDYDTIEWAVEYLNYTSLHCPLYWH